MSNFNKLSISFDNPEHGWISLAVHHKQTEFDMNLSYVSINSFEELIKALGKVWIESYCSVVVKWLAEPDIYELRFSRKDNDVLFEIYWQNGSQKLCRLKFNYAGNKESICLPFWRALRSLEGRFSPDELTERWHCKWPSDSLRKLTEIIQN